MSKDTIYDAITVSFFLPTGKQSCPCMDTADNKNRQSKQKNLKNTYLTAI